MSENKTYLVDLYVGKDIIERYSSPEIGVRSILSRQMLCDMTANIEYNVWAQNKRIMRGDTDGSGTPLTYRNLNYIITGMRGSGKSTFLNNLVRCLTREIDPFDKVRSGDRNRYSPELYIGTPRKEVVCKLLCSFDPSFPGEGRGSFLISVVAAIQSLLEQAQRNHCERGDEGKLLIIECGKVLKMLGKGIVRLSQGKSPLQNLSEYEVVNLRSENAVLEEQIRNNFRRAMDLLCRIYHVDAFIVTIDDADTRFAQCADVIEDLRLYMTHRRLVVILAGDKDLYLERIRELHFKEYDKDYFYADTKGQGYRMDFVMTHASQYIIKQFPLENQYELRDIMYLSKKMDPIRCQIRACIDWNRRDVTVSADLIEFVNAVFKTIINTEASEVEQFVNLFLSMPLRSVIQMVNAWVLDDVWNDMLHLGVIASGNPEVKPDKNQTPRRRLNKINHLRNIVLGNIYSMLDGELRASDYKFDKISVDDSRSFYHLLLRLCLKTNDMEHGYFLTGEVGGYNSDRWISLLLALASGNFLRDMKGALSYFLFGPATVSLFAKSLEQEYGENRQISTEDKEKLYEVFSHYLHVGSWNSPTRWARHANMIWGFDSGREALHNGILRLRYEKLVSTLQESVFTQTDTKLQLAMLVSMSHADARDHSYFISLFSFLAFILKCIQVCENTEQYISFNQASKAVKNVRLNRKNEESQDGVSKMNDEKKPYITNLRNLLKNVTPIKSCLNPEWLIKAQEHVGYNTITLDEKIDFSRDYQADLDAIAEEIYNWYLAARTIETKKMKDDISAQKMGELWSDMYYYLKGISYSEQDVRMTSSVPPLALEALSAQILKVSEYVRTTMCRGCEDTKKILAQLSSSASSEKSMLSRSEVYRKLLGAFPLTSLFCDALKMYSVALAQLARSKGMQDSAADRGPNEGLLDSSAIGDFRKLMKQIFQELQKAADSDAESPVEN